MQVTDPGLFEYLQHRIGKKSIDRLPKPVFGRALELNTPRPDISSSFGQPNLTAYVGFVDLAGFTTTVCGRSPDKIAEYLEPFLSNVVDILRDRCALIDKTIGDEVMFVLPEIDERDRHPEVLYLGQIMGALHDLAFNLRGGYRFRISISYGTVRFFCIEGANYTEWTTVGEPIHVAKRLQGLCELENPNPVAGSFGMKVSPATIDTIRTTMRQRLSIIAGFASRFGNKLEDDPRSLKGVGDVLCSILVPRPERVRESHLITDR